MRGGRLGSISATVTHVFGALAMGALFAGAASCGGDAFTSTSSDGGEVGADVRIPDAASTPDGGAPDAAAPPDAGDGWCATQSSSHTFCEDFLHGVPDKLVGVSVNAMIEADTADFVSAPQSMASITSPLPSKGEAATAFASHAFSDVAGTQFTLASYFKVASSCFATKGSIDPVAVTALLFADSDYEIAIGVTPDAIDLVEYTLAADGGTGNAQLQSFDAANLVDSWQLWTLTIGGGIPKTINLTIGSTTVIASRTTMLKNAPAGLLQHPSLFVGANVKNDQGLSPGCKVNVDDILFDVKAVATPG